MKYKLDHPEGIKGLLQRHPGVNQATRQGAQKTLAIARSRAPRDSGQLASSGRVENAGIRPVKSGQARITWRVTFYARYAMDIEMKTGFLSGAVGRRVR